MLTRISAILACVLAGAALAVSLLRPGPAGPAGPQGHAGRNADAARLRYGICWQAFPFTQNWGDGSQSTWISSVDVSSPQMASGVYTCPQGESFVSIIPLPASTASP